MLKRRDVLAIVLIVLPWTLLITVWHQSASLLCSPSGRMTGAPPGETQARARTPGVLLSRQGHSGRWCAPSTCTPARPGPTCSPPSIRHPTYSRPVQKAELTRLANTFLHVPNLHSGSWWRTRSGRRAENLALRWLRETFSLNGSQPGRSTSLASDNTYSLELFGGGESRPAAVTLHRHGQEG
ncbi:hypothetical protein ANANG_G00164100 [Anguilla anguilla]|uniref:Uncharacterized protein n=1 Tax=Anguilla anguilla TaxID=7936 RepID=A0A9D3RVE4_ANGAN|nr:hypothetical protein ANANG_G00164100 [Anguilla anguilla]